MFNGIVRARLHQTSAQTQSQHCDDASDTALIEINGVALEWIANHFGATPLISMRAVSHVSSQH